jgi:DnaK suppressor protein
MTTLTAKQLAQLKHTLNERRKALLAAQRGEYGDLAGANLGETREPQSHRDEASTREAYDDVRNALAQHEREELFQIDQAFVRINQHRYGECVECGAPIGYARLAATPYTARCVTCQTKFERRGAASRTGGSHV